MPCAAGDAVSRGGFCRSKKDKPKNFKSETGRRFGRAGEQKILDPGPDRLENWRPLPFNFRRVEELAGGERKFQ